MMMMMENACIASVYIVIETFDGLVTFIGPIAPFAHDDQQEHQNRAPGAEY